MSMMILPSSISNFSFCLHCHVLHLLTCNLQPKITKCDSENIYTIFCFQYMPFVEKKSGIDGTHYFDGYAIALLSILSNEINFREVPPFLF